MHAMEMSLNTADLFCLAIILALFVAELTLWSPSSDDQHLSGIVCLTQVTEIGMRKPNLYMGEYFIYVLN